MVVSIAASGHRLSCYL